MPAASGIDDVLANVAGQFAMFPDSYEYTTINAAADGDVVMNERLDHIKGPDGTVHACRRSWERSSCATARSPRWTDYWDTGLIGKMMAGEEYAELVPEVLSRAPEHGCNIA